MWSRSINQADIKFAQGTSVFTSKGEASQGTIWSKYYTPYALFKTYMVYNDMVAKRQNISVSDDDIENFKQTLLTGIKSYKSTSKNQMPRLLAEIVYKDNYIDGEMDYIQIEKKVPDLEQRGIEDFTFDLSPLMKYYDAKKEHIEKINIYQHEKVVPENLVNLTILRYSMKYYEMFNVYSRKPICQIPQTLYNHFGTNLFCNASYCRKRDDSSIDGYRIWKFV